MVATDDVRLRRLHVSGFPAGADLRAKFAPYGRVVEVEGADTLNGVGEPRGFAYIALETSQSQINKCMNKLSASTWAGKTFRIAEAKPDFEARLDKERADPSKSADERRAARRERKRLRKLGATVDDQTESLELASLDNIAQRKGWRKSVDKSTPIFPIVDRPLHPLPPLPSAEPALSKRKLKKLREAAAPAPAEDAAAGAAKPPTRARRVKIDPTQWQATHLRGEKEMVRAAPAQPSPRKKARIEPPVPEPEPVTVEATPSSADDDVDASEDDEALEEPERQELLSSLDAHELATERAAQAAILASLLGGDAVPAMAPPVEVVEAIESSSEDEAEPVSAAPVATATPMQVRAPAAARAPSPVKPVEPPKSKAAIKLPPAAKARPAGWKPQSRFVPDQDDSSADEGEGDEDEMAVDAPPSPVAPSPEPAPAAAGVNLQFGALKDMFKPKEAEAGFSLAGLLDEAELDLEPEPAPMPEPRQTYRSVAPAPAAPSAPIAAPATDMLFFPYPPPGLPADELDGDLVGRSWTAGTMRRFRRVGSADDVAARHEERRPALNQLVRTRHREGVRRAKRLGVEPVLFGMA